MKKAVVLILICFLLTGCGQPEPTEPTLAPNPYTAEDFVSADGFITCTAGSCEQGIDVSAHQGEIDWTQVAQAGIAFAYIRLAYRGYVDGLMHEDETWHRNYEGATAAGIRVGAYVFSQAVIVNEAREEAEFALSLLDGCSLELPLVFDWEVPKDSARTASTVDFTALAEAFRDTVKQSQYTPGVYFNAYQGQTAMDLLSLEDCTFWLAYYKEFPDVTYKVDYWQYSSEGTVPGIDGNVDLDLHFTD